MLTLKSLVQEAVQEGDVLGTFHLKPDGRAACGKIKLGNVPDRGSGRCKGPGAHGLDVLDERQGGRCGLEERARQGGCRLCQWPWCSHGGGEVLPFALGPVPTPKGLFATLCNPLLALVETGPVSDWFKVTASERF